MKKRTELSDQQIISALNAMCPSTLMETLNISYTEVAEKSLSCTMRVTEKMMRPGAILHGGATMALIETVGSSASLLFMDTETEVVLGLDVSSNHLHPGRLGDILTATADAIHIGRTTQLWQVKVTNQDGRLISQGKVTNIVMPKQVIEQAH